MPAKQLTRAEKAWIKKLQAVLDECPSKRFGFYTIGDPDVTIIDLPVVQKYENENRIPQTCDYCQVVHMAGAELGRVFFPDAVQSTAG